MSKRPYSRPWQRTWGPDCTFERLLIRETQEKTGARRHPNNAPTSSEAEELEQGGADFEEQENHELGELRKYQNQAFPYRPKVEIRVGKDPVWGKFFRSRTGDDDVLMGTLDVDAIDDEVGR